MEEETPAEKTEEYESSPAEEATPDTELTWYSLPPDWYDEFGNSSNPREKLILLQSWSTSKSVVDLVVDCDPGIEGEIPEEADSERG